MLQIEYSCISSLINVLLPKLSSRKYYNINSTSPLQVMVMRLLSLHYTYDLNVAI